MTGIQLFSLVLLVITFTVAIWKHINVGLVILPTAYLLAAIAHISVKTLYAGFPAQLVILVLGVMYLFGHAARSGAIDRIILSAEARVGQRDWLLIWLCFILGALISAIGALPAASVAIMVPIAMQIARRRNIGLTMTGIVTVLGCLAGGFSPISVWGLLIQGLARKTGYAMPMYPLFGLEFALNTALAVVAFFVFGGGQLIGRGYSLAGEHAKVLPRSRTFRYGSAISPYEIASLAAIAVFIAAVLAFGLDVGLVAFALAVLVHLFFRPDEREVIRSLPWPAVLIIGGVLTYVSVLLKIGTLSVIARHLRGIGIADLSILALTYFAALFASFESSSVAVLAIVIPVVLAVEQGLAHGTLFLVISAVAFSAVAVSTSPFHLSGAIVISNVGEEEMHRLFNHLLYWTIATAAIVPLVSWFLPLVGSNI